MDDGRLVAEALITKPGVFEYPDAKYPGGVRRELRPDEEVYSRETMDSFANIPCTQKHPPMLLTSATAKQHMVGSTGDRVTREPVTNDADWLKTKVMVADAPTIKRMDSGDNATSCGYACVIEEKSGVDPKYGRYDVIQRRIRGNHLAVGIPSGRAGRLARVRMDSEVSDEEREATRSINESGGGPRRFDSSTTQGATTMDEIERLKQANAALETGLKSAEAEVAALKTRLDAATNEAGEAKGALKTVEQERDALKVQIAAGATAVETEALQRERARADAAEGKVARFDETVDARVDERAELITKASGVLGPETSFRGMSDRQVMAAVVKRLDSAADVSDGIETSYIKGRFDSLMKSRLVRARQDANVSEILGTKNAQQRADAKDQKMKEFRSQGSRPLSEVMNTTKGA